jgi:hypothetical protein
VLKNDKCRVGRLHSLDYRGLEVRLIKGVDRFGKAKRSDCIDREAPEAKVKVRGFTRCIVSFDDFAEAINLGHDQGDSRIG